ncbi:cytochrome P450 2D15-like isoform X3 [Ambystoma mexicanum]|uniref:cytochrome P450 2D15-like isoform X3 n=1 Tax=Ambystoma mexicanum TaxID=8296 RepID=UPI0037E95EA6
MLALLGLAVFLLVWGLLRFRRAISKLPPGPVPLPLLGNLWMLGFKMDYEKLIQLSTTYGHVYTLWLGHTPMMVVNGFHAVKEALVHHAEEFSDRPNVPFFEDLWHSKGIILANGHSWRQQRRFALMTLRNLGLGKKGFEWRVQKEARTLVEIFSATKECPMDPKSAMYTCVSNVISAVVFGHCFPVDDVRFHQLLEGSETIAYFQGTVLGRVTDDHNTTFNEENMIQVVFDFFMAGSETTTSTLAWALLYMLENPDVQDRVQEELDSVLGCDQPAHYEDRKRLHYTNAVVHEIQRYANLVPGSVLHACSRDTTFLGLPVPKGTVIYPNLGSVLYDPEHWETPQKFNPGHFLDKDGHFVSKEMFVAFGTGPRVCLGERLARVELFVFFTCLLQNFTFRLPEGVTHINMDSILGSMRQPYPFKLCAIARER